MNHNRLIIKTIIIYIILMIAMILLSCQFNNHEQYESQINQLTERVEKLEKNEEEKNEEEKPEDPKETEKINQALLEQNYIRSDIPLDYDTQLLLRAATEEFDIPYELALAVIWKETRYENVTGDNGASYGYMQIQPYWWQGTMNELGATNLMDPIHNFRVGCYILRRNIDHTGSIESALTIYNTGHSGSSTYADSVMKKWHELERS